MYTLVGSPTNGIKRPVASKPTGRVQKTRVIVKSKAKPVKARIGSATKRRSPPKSHSPVLQEQILDSDSEDDIPVRDGAIRIPVAGPDTGECKTYQNKRVKCCHFYTHLLFLF